MDQLIGMLTLGVALGVSFSALINQYWNKDSSKKMVFRFNYLPEDAIEELKELVLKGKDVTPWVSKYIANCSEYQKALLPYNYFVDNVTVNRILNIPLKQTTVGFEVKLKK